MDTLALLELAKEIFGTLDQVVVKDSGVITNNDDGTEVTIPGSEYEQRYNEIKLEVDSHIARQKRQEKLKRHVDPIVTNPLRMNTLTEEQVSDITTYRQALLDVPEQSGFPYTIDWPTCPQWILEEL